ncbi:MAG: hypothetical protein IKZ25_00930 [Clostridia bacterium]|nr:hypothetical protein [Clostridia bacterium]
MKKQNSSGIIIDIILWTMLSFFALFVLKNPKIAATGVTDGLFVCVNQLIPSIFPFMVFSNFIIKTNLHKKIGKCFSKPFEKFLKIGENSVGIVFLSFLSGFPSGALMTNELYKRNQCTKNEAERLMGFCNNASPAFCIAVLGDKIFHNPFMGFLVYICHVFSAFISGFIISRNSENNFLTHKKDTTDKKISTISAFVKSITQSAVSNFYICSFVTFFYAFLNMVDYLSLVSYLNRFLSFSPQVQNCVNSVIFGLIEITNGINMLKSLSPLSLAVSGLILSFSGFCILCQCSNYAYDSNLSMKYYLKTKLLQSVISFILCFIMGVIFLS